MNVNKFVNNFGRCHLRGGFFLSAMAWAMIASRMYADNYTWDGGAGPANDKWSAASNWGFPDTTDVAPPFLDVAGLTNSDIFFAGNIRLIPKVDRTYFIRSLNFNSGAGPFVITPQNSEILRLGAGGIVNNSANIQTLAISLSLSNSQIWNAAAGNLGFSGPVNLNASTLTFAGIFNSTVSNTVSGSGGLVKNDSGTLTLSGAAANTFSGGLALNNGTVLAQKANAFGSGFVTVNAGNLDTATHNQTVGAVTLASGVINGTTGIITGSTYQVQSGTINARLAGGAAMTKSTAGTVTLTSSNLHTGGTTINSGKLAVNNSAGSGTGSGTVTVNNSGVLAGTGNISGAVILNAGSAISPGDVNLVSTLRTGSETWNSGATYIFELKDVDAGAGVGWDALSISGGLTVAAASGNPFFIDVRSLTLANSAGLVNDFDSSQNYSWTIAQTVSGITFGVGESEATVFQLLLGGFANSLDGGTLSLATANAGKDLNLVFTPAAVPEPSAVGVLAVGFGLLLLYHRRFRH